MKFTLLTNWNRFLLCHFRVEAAIISSTLSPHDHLFTFTLFVRLFVRSCVLKQWHKICIKKLLSIHFVLIGCANFRKFWNLYSYRNAFFSYSIYVLNFKRVYIDILIWFKFAWNRKRKKKKQQTHARTHTFVRMYIKWKTLWPENHEISR